MSGKEERNRARQGREDGKERGKGTEGRGEKVKQPE